MIASDDGFTRIDARGKQVTCARSWSDHGAFERFLVDRLTRGR